MSDLEHSTVIKVHADGVVELVVGRVDQENMFIYLTDQAGDVILTVEVKANEVKWI